MTFNSQLPADNSKLRNSAAYIRNNFAALETYLGAANLSAGQPLVIFPPGTRLFFHQDTAPPGWTVDASVADCLLGVKGAGSTYATGGTEAGTWQQTGHQLTVDELPEHNHFTENYGYIGSGPGNPFVMLCQNNQNYNHYTANTGSNQPHNHGSSWRPRAAVGIIAVKS